MRGFSIIMVNFYPRSPRGERHALRKSKNQDVDLKAALDGLKKDNDYLFEGDNPPPYAGGTGKDPITGKYDAETAKIMAAAGLDPTKD